MTNVAFFKGENFTVQVLRLKEKRMTLNVCESGKRLYTVVLKDDENVPDLDEDENEEALIASLMFVKKLHVFSKVDLGVNCTVYDDDEKSLNSSANSSEMLTIVMLISILLSLMIKKF